MYPVYADVNVWGNGNTCDLGREDEPSLRECKPRHRESRITFRSKAAGECVHYCVDVARADEYSVLSQAPSTTIMRRHSTRLKWVFIIDSKN